MKIIVLFYYFEIYSTIELLKMDFQLQFTYGHKKRREMPVHGVLYDHVSQMHSALGFVYGFYFFFFLLFLLNYRSVIVCMELLRRSNYEATQFRYWSALFKIQIELMNCQFILTFPNYLKWAVQLGCYVSEKGISNQMAKFASSLV